MRVLAAYKYRGKVHTNTLASLASVLFFLTGECCKSEDFHAIRCERRQHVLMLLHIPRSQLLVSQYFALYFPKGFKRAQRQIAPLHMQTSLRQQHLICQFCLGYIVPY